MYLLKNRGAEESVRGYRSEKMMTYFLSHRIRSVNMSIRLANNDNVPPEADRHEREWVSMTLRLGANNNIPSEAERRERISLRGYS